MYTIGIDIGGTNTELALVDEQGNILAEAHMASNTKGDPDGYIERLAEIVQRLTGSMAQRPAGIGIGAPNGNYYTGSVDYAPNIGWDGIVPLADRLSDQVGLPCWLTNDANAAALGELQYGAAKGMRDFIVVTLGTGVGGGVVCNGELVYGHDGFAGELGHMTVVRGGRLHWATGLRGSLECYASATGMVITAREMLAEPGAISSLQSLPGDALSTKAIHQHALAGDALAQRVFSYTGEILGMALADFVMFSSPKTIFLFGGVVRAGDLLLNPTKESMEANLLPIFQNKVALRPSGLDGAQAAVLGAAALALGELRRRTFA